jgi:hypothetical protein
MRQTVLYLGKQTAVLPARKSEKLEIHCLLIILTIKLTKPIVQLAKDGI